MQKKYKDYGMNLEKIINSTIREYTKKNLAILHKKSIPIKFKKIIIENGKSWLKSAWITGKSTVDYYGVYQGKFIGFEAKSTVKNIFWLNSLAQHQWKYLDLIYQHGAIAFCLISFSSYEKFFVINYKVLKDCSNKSINLEWCKHNGYEVELINNKLVNLLEVIKQLILQTKKSLSV